MKKEVKYYPLTTGQMILMLSQKYSMKKQINNVCATIHIVNDVDEALLVQSITLAMMRFPSMNCRLTERDGKVVQYFCDEFPGALEIVDMTSATPEQIQERVDKWSSTPFPNKGYDVPLNRVKLIRMPDGTITMYLCICHLIMDAYSLAGCVVYIEQIYQALRDGLPIPTLQSTPIECYESDYAYFSSDRYARDKEYWEKETSEEPHFTSLNGVTGKEFIKDKRYGTTLRLWHVAADQINLRIPKELVDAVQNYAMGRRISPQCMYLLAMRTYLGKVNQTNDVTIMSAVARRATIVQKHAGGTMVNAIPLRTTFGNDLTFADALEQMYKKQREVYRHSDMPCGQILDLYKNKHNLPSGFAVKGYSTVSITFQPYFTGGNGIFDFTFRREKNGAGTIGTYITFMPFDDSGDLWVNYEHVVGYILPESIHSYHEFMLKFLKLAVENPEQTLDQLVSRSMS